MTAAVAKRGRCVVGVVACEVCGRPVKSINGRRRYCGACLRELDKERSRANHARAVERRLAAMDPEERRLREERLAKRRAAHESRRTERACASCGGHCGVSASGYCSLCRADGSDLLHKFTGRRNTRTKGDFEHWTARTTRKAAGGWRGRPTGAGMAPKRPLATC